MSNVIAMPRYKLAPEVAAQVEVQQLTGVASTVVLMVDGPVEMFREETLKNLKESKGRAKITLRPVPDEGWLYVEVTCGLSDLPHVAEHELIGHLFFRKLLVQGFIVKNPAFRAH